VKTFFYFILLAYGIFYRDMIISAFAAWMLYDRFVLDMKPAQTLLEEPPNERSLILS
jgi:hypothetical protein